MSELRTISEDLEIRYARAYLFASKLTFGSWLIWYIGLAICVIQLVVQIKVALEMQAMPDWSKKETISVGLNSILQMGILAIVLNSLLTFSYYYAGSMVLGALSEILKVNLDTAVNGSTLLEEKAKANLLLNAGVKRR